MVRLTYEPFFVLYTSTSILGTSKADQFFSAVGRALKSLNCTLAIDAGKINHFEILYYRNVTKILRQNQLR